jgi:hypothetical protein
LGSLVGSAVVGLIAGASGTRKAVEQVRTQERSARRGELSKILDPFLTNSLLDAQHEFQKAVRQMEDAISDDFMEAIDRERDALQRSVLAFQSARTERASAEQRDEHVVRLRGQCERIDKMQAQVERIARSLLRRARPSLGAVDVTTDRRNGTDEE